MGRLFTWKRIVIGAGGGIEAQGNVERAKQEESHHEIQAADGNGDPLKGETSPPATYLHRAPRHSASAATALCSSSSSPGGAVGFMSSSPIRSPSSDRQQDRSAGIRLPFSRFFLRASATNWNKERGNKRNNDGSWDSVDLCCRRLEDAHRRWLGFTKKSSLRYGDPRSRVRVRCSSWGRKSSRTDGCVRLW